MPREPYWTPERVAILRALYPKPNKRAELLALLPGKPMTAFVSAAYRFKIPRPKRAWSEEEDAIIRAGWEDTSPSHLAEKLPGRTVGAVNVHAIRPVAQGGLGLAPLAPQGMAPIRQLCITQAVSPVLLRSILAWYAVPTHARVIEARKSIRQYADSGLVLLAMTQWWELESRQQAAERTGVPCTTLRAWTEADEKIQWAVANCRRTGRVTALGDFVHTASEDLWGCVIPARGTGKRSLRLKPEVYDRVIASRRR